jgi:GntR family transcriptional regulator, arabinose operon transcriptional repressor
MVSDLTPTTIDRTSHLPVYQQVVQLFRSEILKGTLPSGTKLPTDQELAEALQISRGTATKALRTLAQEGMIERSPKLGNRVSRGASRQAPATTVKAVTMKALGLLLPRADDALSMGVVRGVQAACRSRDYHLLSAHSQENAAEESHETQRMLEVAVAGIIMMPLSKGAVDEAVTTLQASGLPFTLIDRHLPGVATNYVGADHYGGAFAATEHLILLGHAHITFFLNRDQDDLPSSVQERLEGYHAAMRRHGLSSFVYEAPLPEFGTDPAQAYETFFQTYPLPKAVVAINDEIASYLLQSAERLGVTVPRDLALVGFDDIPLASRLTVPLTTVAQPFEEIGSKAAHLLIDAVEGKTAGPKRIILPTHLKIRSSCGARLRTQGSPRGSQAERL